MLTSLFHVKLAFNVAFVRPFTRCHCVVRSHTHTHMHTRHLQGPNKPTIVKGSSEPGSDSGFEMDNGMFQSGSKFNHAVNRLDIEYRDKTHKDL